MSDLREMAGEGCLSLALAGLVMVPIGVGAYFLDRQSCYTAWEDFAPEYGIFSGCRVTFNGKRVPTATLRKVDLED